MAQDTVGNEIFRPSCEPRQTTACEGSQGEQPMTVDKALKRSDVWAKAYGDREIGPIHNDRAALLALAAEVRRLREGGWEPIETAPENKKSDYFFCIVAWGPEEDENTGLAMRYKGQWFAASVFCSGGPFDQRQYEFREHNISPTYWRPYLEAPNG